MFHFQILLKPAILSADKHGLPKLSLRQCGRGNPVTFLSGKEVFLTIPLAWSCCVVTSNLSRSVASCSTCKSLNDKIGRGCSGDVRNRDVLLCALTGDSGRSQKRQVFLCCMFIWQLFRIFYWLWGSRHVLSSHFGTHGTVDFTHSGKLHENRLLTCLGNFLNDLLNVFGHVLW